MTKKHLDTTLVQAGRSKKYTQGSVNSVIQRASSLVFDTVEDKKIATRNRAKGGLFYGRRGTLTHFSLQEGFHNGRHVVYFHGDRTRRFQEHNARVGLNKLCDAFANQRIEPARGLKRWNSTLISPFRRRPNI